MTCLNMFYFILILALTFDNFQVVDSIKCYYYPLASKAYRYSTECYYSCCTQPAKTASEACCDGAGSFAALAMMITALICLCCLSCISGILIFVFCFKKKPRPDNSSIITRQMQSVNNPIFTSQNFKFENVNELPKYEDLNLNNLNQNLVNTTSSLEQQSTPSSIVNSRITSLEPAATPEITRPDAVEMNEIDLRSNESTSIETNEIISQTNNSSEFVHQQQQQQTSQV